MSEAEFKDAYGNARRLNGASTDEQLSVRAFTPWPMELVKLN